MIETIAAALDNKEEACITCCDLSKAFDCVEHTILIEKMERYGIRGVAKSLMASYLKDRQQSVDWRGNISALGRIDQGVAQGSVLSAILFVIYINDLPINVPGTVVNLFADDTSFLHRAADRNIIKTESEDTMASAAEWFATNNLCLNVKKTQQLYITTKEKGSTSSVKFLGLHLSHNLKWNDHIENMTGKLSSAIYVIRRIRKIATFQAALMTYHACFLSRATYGILVWGGSPEAHRVFLLQKEAIRALTKSDYRASCRLIFKKYKLLTLPSVYICQCLLYVHRNSALYPCRHTIHEHATRQRHKKEIPRHHLTRTQNTTKSISVRLYNKLPKRVTDLNIKNFTKAIKDVLINNVFYSIDEYLNFDFI